MTSLCSSNVTSSDFVIDFQSVEKAISDFGKSCQSKYIKTVTKWQISTKTSLVNCRDLMLQSSSNILPSRGFLIFFYGLSKINWIYILYSIIWQWSSFYNACTYPAQEMFFQANTSLSCKIFSGFMTKSELLITVWLLS